MAIALVLSASVLAPLAAADRDDRGFRERGEFREHFRGGDFDRDRFGGFGVAGIVPVSSYVYPASYSVIYTYPAVYPASYTVFMPAYYGGNQGACYQACVSSGQYSPAQCGQMCYYA